MDRESNRKYCELLASSMEASISREEFQMILEEERWSIEEECTKELQEIKNREPSKGDLAHLHQTAFAAYFAQKVHGHFQQHQVPPGIKKFEAFAGEAQLVADHAVIEYREEQRLAANRAAYQEAEKE